jgi:hypothetical protein
MLRPMTDTESHIWLKNYGTRTLQAWRSTSEWSTRSMYTSSSSAA